MVDLEGYLYKKVKEEMDLWEESDIYAVSFLVNYNETHTYGEFTNVTHFSISYNTESSCEGEEEDAEERWNCAFWPKDEVFIVDTDGEKEGVDLLFQWYKENGIENIGYESEEGLGGDYDLIEKGPIGFYELLMVVSEVAKRLQNENYLRNKFGQEIPIIIHDFEYSWFTMEATKIANPKGEAEVFLEVYS